MKRIVLAGLLLLIQTGALLAQEREHGPLLLQLPASTRALALGNVFPLRPGDSDAIFYNPALLEGARGIAASGQRFGGASHLGAVSGATAWWSGSVGLGVQVLEYGARTRDAASLPADEGSLLSPGTIGAAEIAATAAFATEVRGVRVGIATKLIDQRLGPRQDATAAVDFGAAMPVGPAIVGFSAQNLGPGLSFGEMDVPLPYRLTLGATTRPLPVGPLDLAWAGAVLRLPDGSIVPGGGMEVSYWPVRGRTFTGRVGLRRVPDGSADVLTFGGAFTGDRIALEYAFQGYDGGKKAHRVGIAWR